MAPAVPADDIFVQFPTGQIGVYWVNNMPIKETKFFTYLYDGKNLDFYEGLFDDAKLGFEASVEYLHIAPVADRIKEVYRDLKFIVLLRDPVKRAWSHYWHERYFNKSETLPFDEAIKRKIETTEDWYFRSYLQIGHYAQHLTRWFDLFGRENFLVIQSEALFSDADFWFKNIQMFLGLDPISELDDYLNFGINFNYPKMDAATEKKLTEYFEPHNEKLYTLLNRKGEACQKEKK